MSDLYHEAVPDEYIQRVFEVMVRAEQHVFQVLTKRSERLPEIAGRLPWPPNVWQGVSVENARLRDADRRPGQGPRRRAVSLRRAAARPDSDLPSRGHPLGDLRWRSGHERRDLVSEWARADPRPVRGEGCPVLLQAVGRADVRSPAAERSTAAPGSDAAPADAARAMIRAHLRRRRPRLARST